MLPRFKPAIFLAPHVLIVLQPIPFLIDTWSHRSLTDVLNSGRQSNQQLSIMFSLVPRAVLRQARPHLQQTRVLSPAQQSILSRLLSTLAVLEQRDGKLQNSSLSAVTAAQKLGGSITGFVAGSGVKAVAEEAAKVKGIEKIIMVDNGAYDKGLPENFAPLLVENIKKGGYTHIISSHSAFGKNLMPRVAALLDSQQISDIITIEGEDSMTGSTVQAFHADPVLQHSYVQYTPEMPS